MKKISIDRKIKYKIQAFAAVMTILFAFGTVTHASTCATSSGSWVNSPLSQTATGSFRVAFDATPSAGLINGTMGLSYGPASGYTSLAAIVRFNGTGTIDARNGGVFAAVANIPYLAGTSYHFILDVNAVAHTYNAYVMIGSVQTTIGSNFAFRTEQATTSSLNNLGAVDTVGNISVCNAALSVPPSITSQPVSKAVIAGNTASFTVVAAGTAPLTFQWKRNGVAISGATSSAYTTPAETTADNNAQFTATVSNTAGSATSASASLTVNAASQACVTSSGAWANFPLSQTATGSFRVAFDATASAALINGTMGLSFGPASGYTSLAAIVRFNETGTIDARNGSVFAAIANIPYLAGTSYHFILDVNAVAHTYNAYVMIGSVQTTIGSNFAFRTEQATTSSLNNLGAVDTVGNISVCNAALTLTTAAPSITSQPVSRTVIAGNTVSFTAAASGTAPLAFQWKKNGVAISGATSSAYTTPAETTADNNAQFTVAVSNTAGSATSNAATLTVSAATLLLNSSSSALSFGSVNVSGSSTQTVTLTNAGNTTVTVSNVTISGAGFNAAGVPSGLIMAPGQTAALTATFAPSGSGSVTGRVSVASNATNSPDSISLSGTGVAVVNHSVGLSWLPSTSAVMGYNTYSSAQSGGPYTKLTSTPVASTSYSDSTVQAGKTYYFVVTSVDSSNMESAYSSEVSALVP